MYIYKSEKVPTSGSEILTPKSALILCDYPIKLILYSFGQIIKFFCDFTNE